MRKLAIIVLAVASTTSMAQPTPPMAPDIPPKFDPPRKADFVRREVMIAMRDGVKLKTVILIPNGAKRAPMILTRTPYDAQKRAQRAPSNSMAGSTGVGVDALVAGGYILVYQDVRGKYGSEGDYVMTRPLRGPLNNTAVDHATDAYDTIDWLVKNVHESNGKVGMMGSSYEGFTVLMALANPHPALRAGVPMCPMVDGWRGDDWFHNGAYRQVNMGFFLDQNTARGDGTSVPNGHYDDYEAFRRAGSAASYAKQLGIDALPFWKKLTEHPTYDVYWQGQALDKVLAKVPLTVPTMFVAALYDQEDSYGGVAAYLAREALDQANEENFLVLGPWRHSGMSYDGRTLGPLDFGVDTAAHFRRDVLRPFFDARLKDKAPPYTPPPVYAFVIGTHVWKKLPAWPPPVTKQKLYLGGFTPPTTGAEYDEYTADPREARAVRATPCPIRGHGQLADLAPC
ncbi:MAG TPA: CocE/NonD family hydrolase [Kofleriaceae bacterium]|nr:CocE/NonD family hydrolase [Kofleriaceae bacterium]